MKLIVINDPIIDLIEGKELFYGLIYSIELVQLKILKIYIKKNLANGFIRLSKSLTTITIFSIQTSYSNLHLCINHQGQNNLIIKNWSIIPLMSEFSDELCWAKSFT